MEIIRHLQKDHIISLIAKEELSGQLVIEHRINRVRIANAKFSRENLPLSGICLYVEQGNRLCEKLANRWQSNQLTTASAKPIVALRSHAFFDL